jgi:hypothetical protein
VVLSLSHRRTASCVHILAPRAIDDDIGVALAEPIVAALLHQLTAALAGPMLHSEPLYFLRIARNSFSPLHAMWSAFGYFGNCCRNQDQKVS